MQALLRREPSAQIVASRSVLRAWGGYLRRRRRRRL